MPLFRFFLLALLLTPASFVPAQIVGLELAEGKPQIKHKKWAIEKNGRLMVCGEVISGLTVDVQRNSITKPAASKQIVIVVPDPARPELELVEPDSEGLRVLARHRKYEIMSGDLAPNGYHILFRHQSLIGLRSEYQLKMEELDQAKDELREQKSGTPEWFQVHRKVLAQTDALSEWLRGTLFPAAAKKLDKEYKSELERLGKAASESRLESAKKALGPAPIPELLVEKSAEFGRSELKWHALKSQHLRMVSFDGGPNLSEMEAALKLGETIIESFRNDFVDPFLTPEDTDPIPEGLFAEFFFCPDDEALAARYYEEYYGKSIGQPRERVIKLPGRRSRNAFGVDYLDFWRIGAQRDVEGIVAHGLGHHLSDIVFNGSTMRSMPDWIAEGFGFWISFDFLSRNSVNCVAFSLPTYAKSALKEGVKPTGLGMRAAFNDLALDKGPTIDRLMQIELVEMEPPDLAKAWSFLDFLIAEHPGKAVVLFKEACAATGRDGRMNIETVRPTLEKLFEVTGVDVYKVLDEQWRRYAVTGQKTEKKRR